MDEFERGIGCLDRRIIKVLLIWVFKSPTPMPTPNTQPTTWSGRPVVLSLRVAGWAARWQFGGVSRQKYGKRTDDWIHTIEAPLFRPKAASLTLTPMGHRNKVEDIVLKEASANCDSCFYLTGI